MGKEYQTTKQGLSIDEDAQELREELIRFCWEKKLRDDKLFEERSLGSTEAGRTYDNRNSGRLGY